MEGEGVPMRDISSNINGTDLTWRSPMPYLFLGIGSMLILIAIALIILAIPFMRSSSPNGGDTGEQAVDCGNKSVLHSEDMEDKAMVIMAGDETPSFLAQPAAKFPDLGGGDKRI